MPKFCKDCNHCIPAKDMRFALCGLSKREPSCHALVTGLPDAPESKFFFCFVQRQGWQSDDCGPEGKHFEPKAPPVIKTYVLDEMPAEGKAV